MSVLFSVLLSLLLGCVVSVVLVRLSLLPRSVVAAPEEEVAVGEAGAAVVGLLLSLLLLSLLLCSRLLEGLLAVVVVGAAGVVSVRGDSKLFTPEVDSLRPAAEGVTGQLTLSLLPSTLIGAAGVGTALVLARRIKPINNKYEQC